MKIVIDNKIPFIKGILEPFANVEYIPGKEINAEDLQNANALITRTRTKCNEELLAGSQVKMIASATIGFDHIDTEYCEQNGIQWTNAPGCNSGSVMQYIASCLVFLANKYDFKFKDKTLGIVGVGNVGSKVEKLAIALGMKVLLNDPPREKLEGKGKFVSLETIQKEADIITFHTPLNCGGEYKSFHLVDEEFLDSLKPNAIIINSSRGEVVKGDALKYSLKNKEICGAILDVWENEPCLDSELVNLVDIATPHIAGYSVDGKALGTAMSVQAISSYFNLGLDEWFPKELPKVDAFEVISEYKSTEEIIKKIILKTYDVEEDHKRLVSQPEKCEELRGCYPVRREFHAHLFKISNSNEELENMLKVLGFTL